MFSFSFSPVLLDISASAMRQEKEVKDKRIAKEVRKLFLFIDYLIVYGENPKESQIMMKIKE